MFRSSRKRCVLCPRCRKHDCDEENDGVCAASIDRLHCLSLCWTNLNLRLQSGEGRTSYMRIRGFWDFVVVLPCFLQPSLSRWRVAKMQSGGLVAVLGD